MPNLAQQARSSQGTDEHLFHEGRALAYYEVVTTLLGQAEVFGVEVVSEPGFDPQSLLGQVGQMANGASGVPQDATEGPQTAQASPDGSERGTSEA